MYNKKLLLIFLLLCALRTHAKPNSFTQSLTTRHSMPVILGTIVGYIAGNQFEQGYFGFSSLTCATLGTLAGIGIDQWLSYKKKITHDAGYSKRKKKPATQKFLSQKSKTNSATDLSIATPPQKLVVSYFLQTDTSSVSEQKNTIKQEKLTIRAEESSSSSDGLQDLRLLQQACLKQLATD